MQKPKISVLVVALKSPVLVGVYQNSILIKEIKSKDKTTQSLPYIFQGLLEKYDLENLYYANGPGSYMSIKITYIFLRTLAISKGIQLFASCAFNFCNNSPIKALGKKFFIKLSQF